MDTQVGRRRIVQLAVREAGRACRAAFFRFFSKWSLKKPVPTRLLFSPQDLRTGDPTVAGDIYSGFFVFSGRVIATSGRSPFEYEPPSQAWGESLYGFGWLRHLRAASTALAQANARALVDDFIHQSSELPPIAARADVKARRLISFICQSPLLLEGADRGFYQRFLKTIGQMSRELDAGITISKESRFKLMSAIGCCYAGLCSEGMELLLQRAIKNLAKELDEQILPDGGHISRNPQLLVEFLFYLIPLRQLFTSRDMEPPSALIRAMDRMLPMVRMLRHGDGNLARFNGMAATDADHLATLLLYDDVRARPIQHATHSGYERLEAGKTLIIADIGKPPPVEYSTEATAGALSFEMSHDSDIIVVNCGSPFYAKPNVIEAARTTAAHSTASINHASSLTFLAPEGKGLVAWLARWLVARNGSIVLNGPKTIQCDRGEWNNGTMLSASHNGFEHRFGVVHERRWFVADDGMRVNGEDVFQGAVGSEEIVLRFHLAPTVKAARAEQSTAIILALPSGDLWQFESNPAAQIEDSVFFASSLGVQKSLQLVITFKLSEMVTARWRFTRVGSVHSLSQKAEQMDNIGTDASP